MVCCAKALEHRGRSRYPVRVGHFDSLSFFLFLFAPETMGLVFGWVQHF
jgi:hypothetical protein